MRDGGCIVSYAEMQKFVLIWQAHSAARKLRDMDAARIDIGTMVELVEKMNITAEDRRTSLARSEDTFHD